MAPRAATVFRDHEVQGVPASGNHAVEKREAREWGGYLEAVADAQSAGGVVFTTLAQANANLAYPAKQMAWVIYDGANTGIYQKQLGSGSGSWLRVGTLPYSFSRAVNSGAGSANAIIASYSTEPPGSSDTLIFVNATHTNTSTAPTVKLGTDSPRTIVTVTGGSIPVGGIVPNMVLAGVIDGGQFRLLSDLSTAAYQAGAQTAATAAAGSATSAAASAASAAAIVGSGAFTQAGTGAVSRSVQSRLREEVSVVDFGAVGDSFTDDTAAFAAAIASLPGGGIIRVPRGWWRITSTLTLHSGLEFRGDGCTNLTFGVPSNNERPSHIFLDADTGILFGHTAGVQMESVRFYDLSFSARVNPYITPRGSTVGFNLSGSYPNDIKHLTFERCQFANFGGYAIRVLDPLAPHSDPDWNVCPVEVTDCSFFYNTVGIQFEADNADYWRISGTNFVGTTYGIIIQRGGMLTMIDCCGGGAGTYMVVCGTGANHIRDNITMIGCQYESAEAMLWVQIDTVSQALYRPIRLISCAIESPILLTAQCHLITDGCRWVSNLEVTSFNSIIDSSHDSFLNTTSWNIADGSEVRNFITDGQQLPLGVRGYIINGQHVGRGTAAPSGGSIYYKIGDEIRNTAPATGQPFGWVCTVAGVPGTWKPFGTIS